MTLKNYDNVAERETPNTHYSTGNYPKDSIDWLTRLIASDTVSRHSNWSLIDDVKAYCEQLCLTGDLTFSDATYKGNLFVTVPGEIDADGIYHGLLLLGHSDVVPVDGQDWSS